jgi:hypothetical protein
MRSCHILGALIVCTFCVLTGRLSAAIVNFPDITVLSFGHEYDAPTPTDQLAGISDGVTFGGSRGIYVASGFTGQFQNGDVLRQHIVAPPGFKFFVFAHPGLPSETFGAQLNWTTASPDSVGAFTSIGVSYDNPQGIPPAPVFGQAGVSGSGQLASFDFHSPVKGNFSFTGMTLAFTMPNSPSAGAHTFTLSTEHDPSFYTLGIGFQAVNAIILGLTPVPEPTGAIIVALSCLFAPGRRHFRRAAAAG